MISRGCNSRQLLGSRNLEFGTLDRPDRQTIKIWKKLDTKPNKSRLFSITSKISKPYFGHQILAVLTLPMSSTELWYPNLKKIHRKYFWPKWEMRFDRSFGRFILFGRFHNFVLFEHVRFVFVLPRTARSSVHHNWHLLLNLTNFENGFSSLFSVTTASLSWI